MRFVPLELRGLVNLFGGVLYNTNELVKAESLVLTSIRPLQSAKKGELSFLSNPKLRRTVLTSGASVVLVPEKLVEAIQADIAAFGPCDTPILWAVPNPYLSYAKIQQHWVLESKPATTGEVDSSAMVDPTAVIGANSYIGPRAVVGKGCLIGEGVTIHPGVVLMDEVVVGDRSVIYPNVTVYEECRLGADCIVHAGVVIGADGFGFANEQGQWVKIPQVGKVIIGDCVEIGANTTIDRGALDDTLIGFGVKLDNQIMIAHNCEIGEGTAVAGCVGMAGSTKIGSRCTIGGAAMLLGHLTIADGTHVSGASAVMSNIDVPGAYTGIVPITDHKTWERNAVTLRQLAELRKQVKMLQKTIDGK